jgi:integrase
MKNEARKQWRGGSIMSQDWFSPKELAGLPGMPGTPHPGELRAAAWEEIDLEEGIWRVPPERMKTGRPHRVPLPRQAVAILNEIRPLAGPGPLVFPGRNDRTKPLSDAAFTRALNRMGYHGRHAPHGTRHLVATELKELRYPGEWIEAQLSHKLPGIGGVYTHAEHMAPGQRPAMMQHWADHLDSLEADNVVQLPTAAQNP